MKISVLTPSMRMEGLEILQKSLKEQTFKDFEWLTELSLGEKNTLNAQWNRMLRRANGELIVFLQDYIKIEPDGLQRFWEAYQRNPDTMFTAAVGKSKNLDFSSPEWDWRVNKIGKVDFQYCEMDWGAAPQKALQDVGGFDEELDNYWSMDNVSVCKRADMLGWKFAVIDNPAIAYDHDAFIEHPFRKDYSPVFSNLRMEEYKDNPKLNYL